MKKLKDIKKIIEKLFKINKTTLEVDQTTNILSMLQEIQDSIVSVKKEQERIASEIQKTLKSQEKTTSRTSNSIYFMLQELQKINDKIDSIESPDLKEIETKMDNVNSGLEVIAKALSSSFGGKN